MVRPSRVLRDGHLVPPEVLGGSPRGPGRGGGERGLAPLLRRRPGRHRREPLLQDAGRLDRGVPSSGATAILTPCPFCFVQFDIRQKEGLPVLYLAELVALAFGATPEQIGLKYHKNKLTSLTLVTLSENWTAFDRMGDPAQRYHVRMLGVMARYVELSRQRPRR